MNDVFAFAKLKCRISTRSLSPSYIIPNEHIDHSLLLQTPADDRGIVIGTIIHHQELNILVGLFVQRFDKFINVLALILARNDYGNQWIISSQGGFCLLPGLFSFSFFNPIDKSNDIVDDDVTGELEKEEIPEYSDEF